MMKETVISVKSVWKSFKEVKAVNGISIEFIKGEFTALLGPNGAGKTTLMEMIEGIQHPDQGEIQIKGKAWKGNEHELHRVLGISLQETHFFEKLRVSEILRLFASFYSLQDERAEEILKLVRLEEKKNAYVKSLSGGQRQRLALGIALINKPEILLLDEPTTGLDPGARREIWEILHHLKTVHRLSMILTTHYMEEADFLCERIVIMDQGKILADGSVNELLSKNSCAEIIEFSTADQVDAELVNIIPERGKHNLRRDKKSNKWIMEVDDIIDYLPYFLERMKQKNLTIKTLECRKTTLEDLFISMTGRGLNG